MEDGLPDHAKNFSPNVDTYLVDKDNKIIFHGVTGDDGAYGFDNTKRSWNEDLYLPLSNFEKAADATKSAVNSIRTGIKNKAKTLADKMKKHEDGGILSAQYTPGQEQTTPAKGELGTTANLMGNKQIVRNFLGKLGGLTDDAMSLGRLLYVNGQTRKRTNDYLKSIQPSLQQPYNVYSQIRGDYGDQNAYDNAGAAIQQKAGKIAGGTSDYTVSAGA